MRGRALRRVGRRGKKIIIFPNALALAGIYIFVDVAVRLGLAERLRS
jgi:hypothetical protein